MVARAVLQHAIAALKQDGFVRSEGRRGLYVTEHPPHLFQATEGFAVDLPLWQSAIYRIEQR